MSKEVIILGGGSSVQDGINLGLWEKIQGKTIWSLNYAFKAMPYLPTRQMWVDFEFFKANPKTLVNLWEQGVEIVCRKNVRYAAMYHTFGEAITQYQTTREAIGYKGKKVLKDLTPFLFCGRMGLVGIFAVSVAIAEGYDTIYLLGYDWGTTHVNDRQTHFYQKETQKGNLFLSKTGETLWSTGVGKPNLYRDKNNNVKKDVVDFNVFKREIAVQIINVSPKSNINYFEKIDYPEFFAKVDNAK